MTDTDTSPGAVLTPNQVKALTDPEGVLYIAAKADECELDCSDPIGPTLRALSARVQELEAALATAREDALREAAETAMEEMRDWKREGFHSEAHAAKCASKAILALIPEQDQ